MPHPTLDPAYFHTLRDYAAGHMVGFTASRTSPDHHQRQQMLHQFGFLNLADGFVTGACVGGDAFIGRSLHDLYPNRHHVVVVPADRSRVDHWWRGRTGIDVIEMPPGTSYRDRNARIVDLSRLLVGHPEFSESDPRSRRSGSWQTVRLARQHHALTPFVRTLEGM